MQTVTQVPIEILEFPTPSSNSDPVSVAVLYEDSVAAHSSMDLVRTLSQNLTSQAQIKPYLWKFDHLMLPQLESLAQEEIGNASIIIVAQREDIPLPESIRAWLDRWLSLRSEQRRALVALLIRVGQHEVTLVPAAQHLQEIAHHSDTEFFVQTVCPLPTRPKSSVHQFAEKTPARHSNRATRQPRANPPQPWGLNE